jgi:hypothetical protein
MMAVAEFAYAQARIEARHGERLLDVDWKTLESSLSLPRYLERARSTVLKRFLTHVSSDMSVHAIERVLRREVAHYVCEIASWAPRRWRPAIAWLAALPLLPLLEGLPDCASPPSWIGDDSMLRAPPSSATESARPIAAAAARLVEIQGAQTGTGRRWLRRWRQLWPQGDAAAVDLTRLADQIVRALASAGGQQEATGGQSSRRDLIGVLTRFFRSHGASPVALVCHVGLVLIDVERLRGGLVRRSLLGVDEERIAA